jgi:hypothetical protein
MTILLQDKNGCTCSESTGLNVHNCQYRKQRDALIPIAVAFANLLFDVDERGQRLWSRVFTRELNRLMREPENGKDPC